MYYNHTNTIDFLFFQANKYAQDGNYSQTIAQLKGILSSHPRYQDAQHMIGTFKKLHAEQECKMIKNNFPHCDATALTDESIALRSYIESQPHFSQGDEDSREMGRNLKRLVVAPDKLLTEDIESAPIRGRYTRMRAADKLSIRALFISFIPAGVYALAEGISLDYCAKETAYKAGSQGYGQGITDMQNNCSFNPQISKIASGIDYLWGTKENISSNAELSCLLNTFMLMPVFYFAMKFGQTENKKYLIAAVAFAGMSVGSFFTEQFVSNIYANKNGQAQGYNDAWGYCATNYGVNVGQCNTSANCNNNYYDEQITSGYTNPFYRSYKTPDFLKSFFLSWGGLLVSLGSSGVFIALGIVSWYFSSKPEIVEVMDNEVVANLAQNYGSTNNAPGSEQPHIPTEVDEPIVSPLSPS